MEEAALLRTVLATPDDDTARLVYADWLAENGQEERATYIRSSVRLAALCPVTTKLGAYPDIAVPLKGLGDKHYRFDAHTADNVKVGDRLDLKVHRGLHKYVMVRAFKVYKIDPVEGDPHEFHVYVRQDALAVEYNALWKESEKLLKKYEVAWRMGPKCPQCGGKGSETVDGYSGVCLNCLGSGYTGSLSGKMSVGTGSPPSDDWKFQIPATWSRGLVHCVTAPLAAFRHTAWTARLWNEWPVTEVVTDKAPEQHLRSDGYHWGPGEPSTQGRVGFDIYVNLELPIDHITNTKFAPTSALAEAALSRAVVKLGRRSAGLSP